MASRSIVMHVGMILAHIHGANGKVFQPTTTQWGYFMKTGPEVKNYYQEHLFYEIHGRSNIVCPQNYFISSIVYSFHIKGENVTTNNEQPQYSDLFFNPQRTSVIELNQALDIYLRENISQQDRTITYKGTGGNRLFQSRELKQMRNPDLASKTGKRVDDREGVPWPETETQIPPAYHDGPPKLVNRTLSTQEMDEKYQTLSQQCKERTKDDLNHTLGPCKTLIHCLGHQACIFYLGNAFCQNDPLPGTRKTMKVMLRCEKDAAFSVTLSQVLTEKEFKLSDSTMNRIVAWTNEIQYISFKQGVQFDQKAIKTIPIPESVFMTSCPMNPKEAGYLGNCSRESEKHPATGEKLWPVLGRVPDPKCRQDITYLYCAYQYNDVGQCLPPSVLEKDQEQNEDYPIFSFSSLPRNGDWPDRTKHRSITDDPHWTLIPVRIGFLIMGHTGAKALVQQIHLLYRPQHFYVVHIDMVASATNFRHKVIDLISSKFPGKANIRVLPADRSFRTSWGSYQILRAELEGMEELLRMGVWDHVINLSGSDMPIRSVDDLADHLATHRGQSFLRVNGPVNYSQDMGMHCAWDFVEMVVSRNRPKWLRDLQFYLQSTLIADETYLSTVFLHKKSPFRNSLLKRGYTYVASLVGDDTDNLCRHREETDICGRGPGIILERNIPELAMNAHSAFFARKFDYDLSSIARVEVAAMTETDRYTKDLNRAVSSKIKWEMTMLALRKLKSRGHPMFEVSGISDMRIVPRQNPTNPCCESVKICPLHTLALEYNYILDIHVRHPEGVKQIKAVLGPRRPVQHSCYPAGHLRLFRITTRRSPPDQPLRPIGSNYPIPFEPAGGNFFWIHIVIQFQPETSALCNATVNSQVNYCTWSKTRMKKLKLFVFKTTLIGPNRKALCKQDLDIQPELLNPEDTEAVYVRNLQCKNMKNTTEGLWTVRMVQKDVDKPMIYEHTILLLQEPLQIASEKKFLTETFMNNTFKVEDVAFVSDLKPSKYYPRWNPKKKQKKVAAYMEGSGEADKDGDGMWEMSGIVYAVIAVIIIIYKLSQRKRQHRSNRSRFKLVEWLCLTLWGLMMLQGLFMCIVYMVKLPK